MQLNNESFEEIIKIGDLDDIFEKSLELFEAFTKKYHPVNETIDKNEFKMETKIIFSLLHHVFSNEKLPEEGDSDYDTDDIDKIQNLIFHLRTIIDQIDNIDLVSDINENESFNFVINYFKEQGKINDGLIETISELDKSLDKLKIIVDINEKSDDICKVILKDDLNKEEFEELNKSLKWFKNLLKEHDKDKVLKVIENIHKGEPENYNEMVNSDVDKKDLSNLIQITTIIKVIMPLEKKIIEFSKKSTS